MWSLEVTEDLNHVKWAHVRASLDGMLKRRGEAAVLLDGAGIDRFGVLSAASRLSGPHRFAVTLALMGISGRKAPDALRPERVKVLDLRGLPITYLPDCFHVFRRLEELYLGDNRLKRLPASIGKASKLQVLSLGQNHLRGLPKTLLNLWPTLKKVHLGSNHIRKTPFTDYDMPMIQRGSIGRNPLSEPIGRSWMLRAHAEQAASRILELFRVRGASADAARAMMAQGLFLARHLDEPMIYEELFRDIEIDSSGRIAWNTCFGQTPGGWLRHAGISLLPSISKGSMVHSSLWSRNIRRLDLSDEKMISMPTGIEKLPCLDSLILPRP